MDDNLFEKIMLLIEKETDMPIFKKNLDDWLSQNEINKDAYEIYKMAYKANQRRKK